MSVSSLRFVVYTAPHTGSDLTVDLTGILAQSSRNNVRDHITGALVYDRGRFVQAFEGPPDAVGRLLGRVDADPRCGALEILVDEQVSERSLEAWSLCVLRTDAAPGIDAAAIRRLRDAYVRTFQPDAAGFVAILRALLESTSAG
jgi:hypothetical protein